MKSSLHFLLHFLMIMVALVVLTARDIVAQEKMTLAPSGTTTWSEIVQREASQPAGPVVPRYVPPPLPGPGPRSIDGTPLPSGKGSPNSSETKTVAAYSDASKVATPPSLSFLAIADNNTVIPPDTHGAVGPSHVMTILNSQVRIQDKTGSVTSTVTHLAFWTSGTGLTGSPFDPKVYYDAGSGRWVAMADADGNLATSKLFFAISATSDPTGSWTYYSIDADAANTTWADYPGFGFNATWIAITQNMFTVGGSPAFSGEKMWVIDKSTALAGGALTITTFATGFDLSGGVTGFTMQPCVTYGSEATLYIVDNSGWASGGTFLIRISRITGTGAAPLWSVVPGSTFASSGLFFVTNNFNFTQIDGDQLGLATDIESNDPRIINAVFRNGRIWCTHTGGRPVSPSTSDRTDVFWYQLNPAAMPTPIVQSGMIDGGVGVHYLFPSITANDRDDMCIGFSRTDATRFTEAVFTGRLGTDLAGTVKPIDIVKLGESSYTKFFGGSRNRWGDYSSTVVDPSDDRTFWTIQEYAGTNVGGGVNDGRWGTWWAKIEPDVSLPIQLSSLTAQSSSRGTVDLAWSTVSEVNNYGFFVERRPATSGQFINVSRFIQGAGTTLEEQHYTWTDENVPAGNYVYRLRQVDLNGDVSYSYEITVTVDAVLGASDGEGTPASYALQQNYPNPFNPTTVIRYSIPEQSHVSLQVFNALGQMVNELVNSEQGPGNYSMNWLTLQSNFASGLYYYRLTAVPVNSTHNPFRQERKMMLMK